MIFKYLSIHAIIVLLITYLCQSRLYVRKNVNELSHKEWEEYKYAIQLMKDRDMRNKYDPFGFNYQANIHGWPEYDGSKRADDIADRYNWHKCQHQSHFFLVWHRMYIFFYERILRKVSNNPNLTIPYWDVFETESRSLPLPFRVPSNTISNPLYVNERCKYINNGKPLSEKTVNPYPALNTNFFSTFKQNNELNLCHSFGGGRLDRPTFLSDREGLLERIPHDNIHVNVGGPDGFFSDLCRSSRDPIFMVHHSNTDRIWESWISAGGRNLIEQNYLNQTFAFYDEKGVLKDYNIGDFLDAKALGYTYDSLIKSAKIDPSHNEKPEFYVPIDEKQNLRINFNKRFITLQMRSEWSDFFEQYVRGEFDELNIKFTLQFDIDMFETNIYFEIYLNLDSNTTPSDVHPNFVGSMVKFDAKCMPRMTRESTAITKCYDISADFKRIIKNDYNFNGFIPQTFNLTFIPKFCDKIYYPQTDEDLIRFNEIYLVFYRLDQGLDYSEGNDSYERFQNILRVWDKTLQSIPDATPIPQTITDSKLNINSN